LYSLELQKEISFIKATDLKDIARVFDCTVRTASNIKSGKTDPPSSKMLKAVKELGWNIEAHAIIREDWLKNN